MKDAFPFLYKSWMADFQAALAISKSAISVHNLLTGNFSVLASQQKVTIQTMGMTGGTPLSFRIGVKLDIKINPIQILYKLFDDINTGH